MTYKRKEVIGDCVLYLGDCPEVMPTLPMPVNFKNYVKYGFSLEGKENV